MTPDEAIRAHFNSDFMSEIGRQFNVNYEVEKVEVLPDGNYRIHFKDGEISDWNITFDEDDGSVLDAYCFNDVN